MYKSYKSTKNREKILNKTHYYFLKNLENDKSIITIISNNIKPVKYEAVSHRIKGHNQTAIAELRVYVQTYKGYNKKGAKYDQITIITIYCFNIDKTVLNKLNAEFATGMSKAGKAILRRF